MPRTLPLFNPINAMVRFGIGTVRNDFICNFVNFQTKTRLNPR
jgi:hypothetical protein